MFVKLTRYSNGEPVYINANKVIAVCTRNESECTAIDVGEELDWGVKESPETVVMLLNSALKGR